MNMEHIELLQQAIQYLEHGENLMGTRFLKVRQKLRLAQNAILCGREYSSSEIKELCNSAYNAVADMIRQEEWEKNEIRGRAAIYRACCRVLNARGKNQFSAARQYADNAEIIHEGYYEIRGFHTKSGNPEVVQWSV